MRQFLTEALSAVMDEEDFPLTRALDEKMHEMWGWYANEELNKAIEKLNTPSAAPTADLVLFVMLLQLAKEGRAGAPQEEK